jgi:hypothetical protein
MPLDRKKKVIVAALIIMMDYQHRKEKEKEKEENREPYRWRPAYEYTARSWSLHLMPPGRARYWLRFTVPQIQQLAPLLKLDQIVFRDRISADPSTALCVVCARLSYPGRWINLADLFGHSPAWLSVVFNDTMAFLVSKFARNLRWHRQLDDYTRLEVFSEAVRRVNSIDGI